MGLDVGIERERDQIRSGLPSPAPVTNIRLFRRDAVAVTSMAGMRLRNQFANLLIRLEWEERREIVQNPSLTSQIRILIYATLLGDNENPDSEEKKSIESE